MIHEHTYVQANKPMSHKSERADENCHVRLLSEVRSNIESAGRVD